MEFSKSAARATDVPTTPRKSPSSAKESKIPSAVKTVTSGVSKTVTPPQSKIPKRYVGNVSALKKCPILPIKSAVKTPRLFSAKKSSKSMVSLGNSKIPQQQVLLSSRSNINTQRKTKSREPTPRSQRSEQTPEKLSKVSDRVAAKKNVLVFESMKEKLRRDQTEFMKQWELVKDDLPPEKGEYKLIGLMKNDDGNLVTKSAPKIKVQCATISLKEIKEDIAGHINTHSTQILDFLDQLKLPSGQIGDSDSKNFKCPSIEDIKMQIKTENSKTVEHILKCIEYFEICDKPDESPKNAKIEGQVSNLLKEVEDLKKNLQQSQKEVIRLKKANEDKGHGFKKELDEKENKLGKKQAEYDELKKKLEVIESDSSRNKTNQRDLQEKFNNKTAEAEDLRKKLKEYSQSSSIQLAKNEEHTIRIKKLEADLSAALKDIERRARMEHSIGDQTVKHADDLRILKTELKTCKMEKEQLNTEVCMLKKDVELFAKTSTQLLTMKDKVTHSELENQTLRQCVKDLENRLKSYESKASVSKETRQELSQAKLTASERNKKIEELDLELTRARFLNGRLEEKIAMDRKLLKVRSNLIESLQTKENAQKIHLEDLFTEVGERKNEIKMLKTELATRNEEFQNLFSTLSAKQLELTRQEHMIKILQESNERIQTMRVKQEAKIGRLEEEVTQLKHTVSLYQDAVLPSNELRRSLFRADGNREGENNENMEYYVDERRRRQNIDMNIRKYEK